VKGVRQLSLAKEELKQSDESFAERYAVLEAVLHGIGEGIIAVDMEGKAIVFNPAAFRILGISSQDAPAHVERLLVTFPTFYQDGKVQVPTEDRPIVRALRGERTEGMQLVVRSRWNPKGALVSCTAGPIVDNNGRRIGAVAIYREIRK
jgi:PAS domain-containing protein